MAAKPSIAIVGAGRWGTALALALAGAGYPVTEIVSRNARASRLRAQTLAGRVGAKAVPSGTALAADIVWLCIPDRDIRPAAEGLSARNHWKGKICIHSSGALGSDVLSSLRDRGAAVASAHPLMTFAANAETSLAEVPFAMEGDGKAVRAARTIVKKLGGTCFDIDAGQKAAYHAFSAFVAPLIVALLSVAEDVGVAAGLNRASARRKLAPIVRQTVENYLNKGAARAFTGPLARGDVDTVVRHLGATQKIPHAKEVYLSLARAALLRLPAKHKPELRRLLG